MHRDVIIFDFGCILTGLDKQRCVDALHRVGAGRIAYYVDECRQEDLFHTLEMGDSTVHEFCEEARRQCSLPDDRGVVQECYASDDDIAWAWNQLLLGVPAEKLRLLRRLHDDGRYRVVVLSNTNIIHWEYAERHFFSCLDGVSGLTPSDFFHDVFLSFEMHCVKPDAEIYQRMLNTLGVEASRCMFIDDSQRNCEAAAALGIEAVHDPHGTEWLSLIERLL